MNARVVRAPAAPLRSRAAAVRASAPVRKVRPSPAASGRSAANRTERLAWRAPLGPPSARRRVLARALRASVLHSFRLTAAVASHADDNLLL